MESQIKKLEEIEKELAQVRKELLAQKSFLITDKIKTYEDVCNYLGIENKPKSSYDQLCDIAKALNEGWKPNFNDINELKHYPYFSIEKYGRKNGSAGLGCCYAFCGFGNASADVGSRLCFKTKELAIYAAQQFKDLYEDYYLGY